MDFPVQFRVETPERIARWRPFVHWLLALPHLPLLALLFVFAAGLWLFVWVFSSITGRTPARLEFLYRASIRYHLRIYSYVLALHDSYPGFRPTSAFEDAAQRPTEAGPVKTGFLGVGDYLAARTDFTPLPAPRKRALIIFRPILDIPAWIVWHALGAVLVVLAIIAAVAILFTGRWPLRLWRFATGYLTYEARHFAYQGFLIDRYPLSQGAGFGAANLSSFVR